MPTKQEILDLIEKYSQQADSKREEYIFNTIGKSIRDRGYLKKSEFLEIVKWKSARAIRKAEDNPEDVIEKITKFTFEIDNEEVKIRVLTSLNGVSIPMASSILTIPFPDKYAVIDVRGWHTLYAWGLLKHSKTVFNIKDWLEYLKVARDLSKEYGVSPREIDKAIFMYDKINREGRLYS